MTINAFEKATGIKITKHSNGLKMEGFSSLSTCARDNVRCAENAKVKGSICAKCFASRAFNVHKNLEASTRRNGKILRDRLFEVSELPTLNADYFRIESFGDVGNVTQARNYIRLAKANPGTRFGWWTKNPDIIDAAIKLEGRPKNISFVLSSLMLNQEASAARWPWVDVVFTVYDKTHTDVKINCGGTHCMDCLRCYKKHRKLIHVAERLK